MEDIKEALYLIVTIFLSGYALLLGIVCAIASLNIILNWSLG